MVEKRMRVRGGSLGDASDGRVSDVCSIVWLASRTVFTGHETVKKNALRNSAGEVCRIGGRNQEAKGGGAQGCSATSFTVMLGRET